MNRIHNRTADELYDHVIADFEKWIAMGAPDPRTGKPTTVAEAIEARARDHWAFAAPLRPEIPVVKNEDWPKTDPDRLMLRRRTRPEMTAIPSNTANENWSFG